MNLQIYLLKRRKTAGNAGVWTESGLRVGDTFGFDYNEMALSTFHQIRFEKRLQRRFLHNENVEDISFALPPILPSLLFFKLFNETQTKKCFLFRRESKAVMHTIQVCMCVCWHYFGLI